MKYKLTISYDGTQYGGWQIQENSLTIQELIQNALQTILRKPMTIAGSGRTDAGVHALGQVAHFTFDELLDARRVVYSLNCLLPSDIRILDLEQVNDDFHARYSARSKVYHYHLHLSPTLDPFKRNYSAHILHKIDLSLLKQALPYFIGTHNFTSFANEATEGSAAKNPVKTISRIDLVEETGGIRLEFEGDGFLYKMVRNIVGTLLEVSAGKIPLSELSELFEIKDRRKAGRTAPPQGLFLVKVNFSS